MKSKIVFLLVAIFLLISCSEKTEYKKFIRLPENHRWFKTDAKVFEFEIKDDSKIYDVIFEFSHIADYQFASVPIRIDIKNPLNEEEFHEIDFNIIDKNGKPLADCGGDICDMSMKVVEKTKLIKGKYRIKVSHNFEKEYLPNVIGIGLKVNAIK
jgi:gliding motility-associated lipoprotein GldH